ncbi:2-iminobutanoate/2-iminopropanoate deaminase-like [Acomys russatus]|uniref:2-iminobutanoate/2-iminopropanoate deaminase-like n=1 Tax=Acomys russatus TaxID=60746 RepID=UPI0021E1C566|nr:2-iminobutanoate/2-iminopropanoate deaminase-like [Acomys russatus]
MSPPHQEVRTEAALRTWPLSLQLVSEDRTSYISEQLDVGPLSRQLVPGQEASSPKRLIPEAKGCDLANGARILRADVTASCQRNLREDLQSILHVAAASHGALFPEGGHAET